MKYKFDKDYPFAVWIGNLGKYNEGDLVGEWVKFPTTYQEMRGVMERIGIGQPVDPDDPLFGYYEEHYIGDYDCYVDGLMDVAGEYTSLDSLNMLAVQLESLNEPDYHKFVAAQSLVDCSSVDDLVHLAGNLHLYSLDPGVKNEYDLGYQHVAALRELRDNDEFDKCGYLWNHINYKSLGEEIASSLDGCFTNYGYVASLDERNHQPLEDILEELEKYKVTTSSEITGDIAQDLTTSAKSAREASVALKSASLSPTQTQNKDR
ncbi:MAG: antirestriction protein ArdA [Bacteroidales bacterium]|nr:antirestriction protein ArdA [Bacteroidales bacterium]